MRKTILPLLIAAWMMTGCASGTPPTLAPILLPPQNLMQPCPRLTTPASGAMTDLLTNHLMTARAYHQCRDRLQGLVDWLNSTEASHELR